VRFKKGNRWKSSKGQLKYKTWRKMVFELNKRIKGLSKQYICEKCGKKRKTTRVLHAHHIFSWNKYPNQRYDRMNGVVMCKYCHDGFHRRYGFEAIEDPKCLLKYLGENKRIKQYIMEKNSKDKNQ
jgi:hypothetical protein